MRAIGKGSLSSILAAALHIFRIFLWIAFVFLTLAMIFIPFLSGLVGLAESVSGGSVNADIAVEAGTYVEIGYYFTAVGVTLFVVNRLIEILKTLRFGSPFVKENADRFRGVGYALLIGEGAKLAFGFLALINDAEAEINSGIVTWLSIVAVFVLSEVFREGARMKEEQDLTV